jgi:Universal stress protein family
MAKSILLAVDARQYAPAATDMARDLCHGPVVEAAQEHDVAVIELGSARSTDLPHIPIGSVTHKVLHLAKLPVMVVPRHVVAEPVKREAVAVAQVVFEPV